MSQKIVTWQEYKKHIKPGNIWVLVDGSIYDVSDYLVEHPGGDAIMLNYSGKDGSERFNSVPHSQYAISIRNSKLVGKIESPQPPEGYLEELEALKKEVKEQAQKKLIVRDEKISREEVALHRSEESCWIIMHGKVYDVSHYLQQHPGGVNKIMMYAGEDATKAFEDQQHSQDALKTAQRYYIGQAQPKSKSGLLFVFLGLLIAAGAYYYLVHSKKM